MGVGALAYPDAMKPRNPRVLALALVTSAFSLLASCDDGGTPSHPVVNGEQPELVGITAAHNTARANVSPAANPAIPPLTWSNTVASAAQGWANRCKWEHSSNGYGENIYASAGQSISGQSITDDWVSEESDYDYAANSCSGVCGHYTQVVWRNSVSIGCGVAHCTKNSPFGAGFPNWDFVVCDYDPPGNYNGQRPY